MARDSPVGILSRTIHYSPVVQFILSAKIRHKVLKDVIFVGETFIQVREFLPSGMLTDPLASEDLGSQILTAKVISTLDPEPIQQEILAQQENDELRERLRREGTSEPPSEMVVLTTKAGEIIYVYAKYQPDDKTSLICGRKALLTDVSVLERYGQHVAVSPKARAMAVAPSTTCCALMSLKNLQDLQQQIEHYDPLRPLKFVPTLADHFIPIEGLIRNIEFLQPFPGQEHHVILLLLLIIGGQTKLVLYKWDNRLGPRTAKPMRCSGQPLPPSDSFPLLVIPSFKDPSFALVTEEGFVFYDHLLEDHAERHVVPWPDPKDTTEKSLSRDSLWTQFAKPVRHEARMQTHDDVILVREDGETLYCEITYNISHRVECTFKPGELKINVDKAFAVVDGHHTMGGDVYIVGGNQTDGGVYHCAARNSPKLTQVLPNLSPVDDVLIIDDTNSKGSPALFNPLTRHRTFVCSGRGSRHGFVTELRHGIEASIAFEVDIDDGLETSSTLFHLSDPIHQYDILLISTEFDTSALSMSAQETAITVDTIDQLELPQIDMSQKTLAAGFTDSGLAIQIVADSVNATTFVKGQAIKRGLSTKALVASVDFEHDSFTIISGSPRGYQLKTGVFSMEDDHIEVIEDITSLQLESEPTSVLVITLEHTRFAILGLASGEIQVFSGIVSTQPKHCFTSNFGHTFSQEIGAIASLFRCHTGESDTFTLLCGSRNGKVVTLEARADNIGGLSIEDLQIEIVGYEPVDIVREPESPSSALLLCGGIILKAVCDLQKLRARTRYERLFLIDRSDLSRTDSHVQSMLKLPQADKVQDQQLSSLVLAISGNSLLMSLMSTSSHLLYKRFNVSGDPRKMAYSQYLNKIIAAADETTYQSTDAKYTKYRRCIRPTLQLLDMGVPIGGVAEKSIGLTTHFGNPGDLIIELLYWRPTDGSKHFEMLVVGLESDLSQPGNVPDGKIIFFEARRDGQIKVKMPMPFTQKPIRSICAIGFSSLVVGAGEELHLLELDFSGRKIKRTSTLRIPSAAVALAVKGTTIFAATRHHSMMLFRVREGKLENLRTDIRSRESRNIVIGPDKYLLADSGSGSQLVRLSDIEGHDSMSINIDAHLPVNLHHLRRLPDTFNNRFNMLGISNRGTIYSFKGLDQDEWQLLRFLESLVTKVKRAGIKFGRRQRDPAFNLKELSRMKPETNMHVRGDVLARELLPGGRGGLRDLLWKEPDPLNAIEAFETSSARHEHFKRLARTVFGQDEKDLLASTMLWVEDVVRQDL